MLQCGMGSLAVLLSMLFVAPAGASPVAGPHGTLDWVAEVDSIQPGRAFWTGLYFTLEKGWHMYWVNPGDSGEPPRVEWSLPAGFRADPIEWPTPQKLGAGTITDYGYENEVLLLVRVHPPANLRVPSEAELSANVKWLVCKDICLPAKASVSLPLPVRNSAGRVSTWHGLFEATRRNLPKPAPRRWRILAVSEKDNFKLTVETGARIAAARFFPLEANQIENAAPQRVTPFARGIHLQLKKSDQLLKPIARLQGVIVLPGPRAFRLDARVVQTRASARGDARAK